MYREEDLDVLLASFGCVQAEQEVFRFIQIVVLVWCQVKKAPVSHMKIYIQLEKVWVLSER